MEGARPDHALRESSLRGGGSGGRSFRRPGSASGAAAAAKWKSASKRKRVGLGGSLLRTLAACDATERSPPQPSETTHVVVALERGSFAARATTTSARAGPTSSSSGAQQQPSAQPSAAQPHACPAQRADIAIGDSAAERGRDPNSTKAHQLVASRSSASAVIRRVGFNAVWEGRVPARTCSASGGASDSRIPPRRFRVAPSVIQRRPAPL
jgi:hypothetical protein